MNPTPGVYLPVPWTGKVGIRRLLECLGKSANGLSHHVEDRAFYLLAPVKSFDWIRLPQKRKRDRGVASGGRGAPEGVPSPNPSRG